MTFSTPFVTSGDPSFLNVSSRNHPAISPRWGGLCYSCCARPSENPAYHRRTSERTKHLHVFVHKKNGGTKTTVSCRNDEVKHQGVFDAQKLECLVSPTRFWSDMSPFGKKFDLDVSGALLRCRRTLKAKSIENSTYTIYEQV